MKNHIFLPLKNANKQELNCLRKHCPLFYIQTDNKLFDGMMNLPVLTVRGNEMRLIYYQFKLHYKATTNIIHNFLNLKQFCRPSPKYHLGFNLGPIQD